MSDQEGKGKQPPADDRTLLDPLGADELKALREAREKLKGSGGNQPQGSAAILTQKIGPDAQGKDEDIGDAPTRAHYHKILPPAYAKTSAEDHLQANSRLVP